jgi:hypothetical protein
MLSLTNLDEVSVSLNDFAMTQGDNLRIKSRIKLKLRNKTSIIHTINKDIVKHVIAYYLDPESLFNLGSTCSYLLSVYLDIENKARPEAIKNLDLRYIINRSGHTFDETTEFLQDISRSYEITSSVLNRFFNIICSEKNTHAMFMNIGRFGEILDADKHVRWFYKYADKDIFDFFQILHYDLYLRFIEKIIFLDDKKGKKKMSDLIWTFLNDTHIIENNKLEWWLRALNHCLHRDDCYDHILLIKDKASLFTLDLDSTEDCIIVLNEFLHFEPSKIRIEYLRLLDFKPVILRISANTLYAQNYYQDEWEIEPTKGSWEYHIREAYEIVYNYEADYDL